MQSEFEHAVAHWRQQFRGDARVKKDQAVTDQDITSSNMVLFGDPAANSVLRRIVEQLPLDWGNQEVRMGNRAYDAEHHVPILIYPNPLNPSRYVVLNSGFTYREYDYLNNARQVPKLPDWAVVDVRQPASIRTPGKIVAADFFDEAWAIR